MPRTRIGTFTIFYANGVEYYAETERRSSARGTFRAQTGILLLLRSCVTRGARFHGKRSIFLRMTDKAGRRFPNNLSPFFLSNFSRLPHAIARILKRNVVGFSSSNLKRFFPLYGRFAQSVFRDSITIQRRCLLAACERQSFRPRPVSGHLLPWRKTTGDYTVGRVR